MTDRVFTGFDLDVVIFQEDANGDPVGQNDETKYQPAIDNPLLTYCFWSKADINAALDSARRAVTGGYFKRIINEEYIYVATVSHMFFKEEELSAADLMNRQKRFRFMLQHHPANNGAPWKAGETAKVLKHTSNKSWKLEGTENGISKVSTTWWAEELI